MTIFLFFIILAALILVHELGHFLAAKQFGIRVDEFGLGFPPRLFGKKFGETVYSINWIPFGGFVRIFGEDPEVRGEQEAGTPAGADAVRRFTAKNRGIQAFVLSAGVLGNLVFAWFLISLGFMLGFPAPVEGRFAGDVRDARLVITSVLSGAPADGAGLRGGDVILSLREGPAQGAASEEEAPPFRLLEEPTAEDASDFIAASEGDIALSFQRGDDVRTAMLAPVEGIVPEKRAIGIGLEMVGTVRFAPFRALSEGLVTTAGLVVAVAEGLWNFLALAAAGEADLSSVSGPVGIAGLVGDAEALGLVYLVSFTAFISINLAVINLVPIPALDGGRLLFVGIEALLRRAISPRVTRALNTAGFSFLILLMILITYSDVVKLLS